MPVRIARGNERVQIAAGALGQGPDADGEKNSAARDALGCAGCGEGRSVFPSDGEYQLSADGFLSIILLPAMIVRFYQGWFQVLVIDLPLFLASTCSISSFYLAAERALYPKTWKRTFLYLPFVMAVGIGLSVRNAVAVMEAIFGVKSEFVRTPKYRVEAGAKGQSAHGSKKKYHKSAGWMPFAEVLLGLYFAGAVCLRDSE